MTFRIELLGGPADGKQIDLEDAEGWPEFIHYLLPEVDLANDDEDSGTEPDYRLYVYRISDRFGSRERRLYAWDGRPPNPLVT